MDVVKLASKHINEDPIWKNIRRFAFKRISAMTYSSDVILEYKSLNIIRKHKGYRIYTKQIEEPEMIHTLQKFKYVTPEVLILYFKQEDTICKVIVSAKFSIKRIIKSIYKLFVPDEILPVGDILYDINGDIPNIIITICEYHPLTDIKSTDELFGYVDTGPDVFGYKVYRPSWSQSRTESIEYLMDSYNIEKKSNIPIIQNKIIYKVPLSDIKIKIKLSKVYYKPTEDDIILPKKQVIVYDKHTNYYAPVKFPIKLNPNYMFDQDGVPYNCSFKSKK